MKHIELNAGGRPEWWINVDAIAAVRPARNNYGNSVTHIYLVGGNKIEVDHEYDDIVAAIRVSGELASRPFDQ